MTEALEAARGLLPAPWLPWALAVLPLPAGLWAARFGERRLWVAGLLGGAMMALLWGPTHPLSWVQQVIGGVAMAAAGAALSTRAVVASRWRWAGFGVGFLLAAVMRAHPTLAMCSGVATSEPLLEHALLRAEADALDEAIVFAQAAVDVGGGGAAELVLGSLIAASGDCVEAAAHARRAHLELGQSLPRLDAAIAECFALQSPDGWRQIPTRSGSEGELGLTP